MTIAEKIQAVFRSKGCARSVVVQTINNDTIQVFCNLADEANVETVMGMIQGWHKVSESRIDSDVVKTYKPDEK